MSVRELPAGASLPRHPVLATIARKAGLLAALAVVLATLSSPRPAQAHVNDNIRPGSDVMMKDLRWPEWDAGTYYCTWYAGFTP